MNLLKFQISGEVIHTVCRVGGRQVCRKRCRSISGSESWPPLRLGQLIAKPANALGSVRRVSADGGRGNAKKANLVPRPWAVIAAPGASKRAVMPSWRHLVPLGTPPSRRCVMHWPGRASALASEPSSDSSRVTASRAKKDSPCCGAGPPRHPETPQGLVRGATRSRA